MCKVKIEIPDNCELIKNGGTYIVKEKKQTFPRSWEEFCEKYPKQKGECCVGAVSDILMYKETSQRLSKYDKNVCNSKEEAEAFLALMQLRQLRKAWVGDWESTEEERAYSIIAKKNGSLEIGLYDLHYRNMLFPTKEMAEDFLKYFKDLCETAKMLL